VVPPFDFAETIPTVLYGDTQLSVSANPNGQISASAVTAAKSRNAGSEYARVGFYFRPVTPGTLRVWASPTYSFEWWTNSLPASPVRSFGSVELTVYGMDVPSHVASSAGANYKLWNQLNPGQVQFDFGFDVQNPLSVQLDVDPSQVYLVFVAVDAHVEGVGWPGSLAGAVASATVPSIRYEFEMRPVLQV